MTCRPLLSSAVTSTVTSSMPARNTGCCGCWGLGAWVDWACGARRRDERDQDRADRTKRSHAADLTPAVKPKSQAPSPKPHYNRRDMPVRDVLIVGAGPSGLATAIAAKHFGLDYVVLEQGALVDAIVRFPINMVFFTTPELLEIGGIPLTTPYDKPTRARSAAVLPQGRRHLSAAGLAVSRRSCRFSRRRNRRASRSWSSRRTSRGVTRVREARNVVLAMGYYEHAEHAERARRGPAARQRISTRKRIRTIGSAS